MKLLTKKQKAVLAQLAIKAYRCLVAVGCPLDNQQEWRREQQFDATGKSSMSEMTQADYVPLANHYMTMIGKPPIKDKTYSATDKAIHRLRDMMARHELPTAYLWSIIKDQFGNRVIGYSCQEIWDVLQTKFSPQEIINLSYTLNNRGRAKTARIQRDHELEDDIPYEPYADPSDKPPGGLSDHFHTTNI